MTLYIGYTGAPEILATPSRGNIILRLISDRFRECYALTNPKDRVDSVVKLPGKNVGIVPICSIHRLYTLLM